MNTNDQVDAIWTHYRKGLWRVVQIASVAGAIAGLIVGYNIS